MAGKEGGSEVERDRLTKTESERQTEKLKERAGSRKVARGRQIHRQFREREM